jgi:hypothetical protein
VKHLSKHHDELKKAVTERLLDSNLTEQLDLTAATSLWERPRNKFANSARHDGTSTIWPPRATS